ncbi:TIGR03619 family F420-dependent LLM class oxidoreductase [Nocardia spumae]|uniref:TIGR03619 family F420-dependent LLM class oxidoreductase n=1 Tax=Nocardia spumae TaxID=2887190 RepID=UPI001D13C173|nr:TIGR03619 family F420-dependent LLM class oxidoreductase [Nocardia spumae]
MRFHFAEAATAPDHWIPLARAVEAAGFTGICVADSLAFPRDSDARYPYTDSGQREFLRGKPFVEPMIACTAILTATTTLRATPFVLKLPVRPPLLVAKQAASLAVLSGHRLSLGVGISPWPQDFTAMGVLFERRGARLDEAIDIVRGLCAGGMFDYHGQLYELPAIQIEPVPAQPIPILVGGHSEAALRRAARRGDGWMHAGGDPRELTGLLHRLAALRAQHPGQRTDRPFEIHVVSPDAFTVDGVAGLAGAGVTDVIVGFRSAYDAGPDTRSLDEKLEAITRYGDTVIAAHGARQSN